MKTALFFVLFISVASFANQNSTFANALNEQAQKSEQSKQTPAEPSVPTVANDSPKPQEIPATKPTPKQDPKPQGQTTSPQAPQPATPTTPADPNAKTLLDGITPNDSELSKANTELLAKNAELTRQVDDLSTQVNVLVQERSGQLFVYGAMTALISVIIGFILAKLLTKQRW